MFFWDRGNYEVQADLILAAILLPNLLPNSCHCFFSALMYVSTLSRLRHTKRKTRIKLYDKSVKNSPRLWQHTFLKNYGRHPIRFMQTTLFLTFYNTKKKTQWRFYYLDVFTSFTNDYKCEICFKQTNSDQDPTLVIWGFPCLSMAVDIMKIIDFFPFQLFIVFMHFMCDPR